MKPHQVIALALAVLVAGVTKGDAEPDRIRARVRVTKVWSPGAVEISVSVPPAATNRGFEVVGYCDGDDVQRTFRQLDGTASAGPFDPIVWRALPGCEYAIAVVLLGAGGAPIASARPLRARILCSHCAPTDDDDPRHNALQRVGGPISWK